MAESNSQPTSSTALVPALSVRDVNRSIAWFEALGFHVSFSLPMPDGTIGHAHLARGGAELMLGPACAEMEPGASGMSLYVTLRDEDLDALYQRARAAGITITREPHDEFWGDRIFEILHPDGYRFTFARHVRDVSTESMQAAMNQWAAAQVPA